jgi:hypothetical protein
MMIETPSVPSLDAATRDFYHRALTALRRSGVPFLIGGAYAYAYAEYTGIVRHTKDLDVFVRERDFEGALDAVASMGDCQREITAPSWLGKVICGTRFVDVIFSSGNGLARVDDLWFERSRQAKILGMRVLLCPPEEMVWSKACVMERERFDGADISHILLARAREYDWAHLLWRFGAYWPVLLCHLILFGFAYPAERESVPKAVMRTLLGRLDRELDEPPPSDPVCQGTQLSILQYAHDIQHWGYLDARERTGGESLREYQAKHQPDQSGTGR